MTQVYFDPAVGGSGLTVSDDNDPSTGLGNGGHRLRFVPALNQMVAVGNFINGRAVDSSNEADASAASAEQARLHKVDAANSAALAGTKVTAATVQADRSEAGAVNSEYWAGLASSTTPNGAIKINPRNISESIGIPAGFNGHSVGPIAINDNVIITIADNAKWSIS